MRTKIPDLAMACAGRFGDHHALLARMHTDHIDHLTRMIEGLDIRIGEVTGIAVHPAFGQRGVGEHRRAPRPRHQVAVDIARQERTAVGFARGQRWQFPHRGEDPLAALGRG
jgi:hypothetical protein